MVKKETQKDIIYRIERKINVGFPIALLDVGIALVTLGASIIDKNFFGWVTHCYGVSLREIRTYSNKLLCYKRNVIK